MALDGEALAVAARVLRDSLHQSQTVTNSVVKILDSFDHRLSGLESAMRPTQIRTHKYRIVHQNIEKTLKVAQSILTQFDVSKQVESKILKGPRDDLGGYVLAVDELKNNIEFFALNRSFKNDDAALNHARALLSKAMEKLDVEFKSVLSQNSKYVEPARLLESPLKPKPSTHSEDTSNESTSTTVLPTLVSPRIVPQLHDIAKRMVGSGHHQQCMKTYRDVRAPVLELSLKKLGVEKLSKEDVGRLEWEVLEGKIGNWIQFMRIAIKLLFAAEYKLCNQVFDTLSPYGEACFASLTQNGFLYLISTGEAVARSQKSPEKLFVLLDMFETMHYLMPEIKTMFSGEPSQSIREAAASLTQKLAQTARETFDDFLDAVEKDTHKSTPQIQDGTVHPLTSYVINYVKFLFDYQGTLRQLYGEDGNTDISNSRLAEATSKIMVILQKNLDGKAKQYKDPALTHIFLMNNIHYMVKSVRRSEAKDILGDDWIQRHRRVVQQHAQQYQRSAWGKVLQHLSGQGLSSSGGGSGMSGGVADSSSGISRAALKERFKNFNSLFEELHQKQSQWSIPDPELREAVRLAVAEVLLPAYRNFLKRYSAILDTGKNTQRYIKYTPEDLDRLLGELFEDKNKTASK